MSKVLGIVTGASRGFGRSICEEFVRGNPNKEQAIDLVLFARSMDGLAKTKESVESISNVAKVIDSISLEMSNIPDVESKFKSVLDNIKWNEYSKICFFNNHGTLYNLNRIEDYTDYTTIQKENDTNTTSFVVTTSLLLKKLKSLGQDYKAEVTFIHSSSLAAIKAFESWGLYCASRAFRDQFFKVVALENKSIRVLNYSLGALDTDMGAQVRETCSHAATREYYISLKTEGKVIHPNTSAAVCSKLVYNNQFESGDHLDFYDEVQK